MGAMGYASYAWLGAARAAKDRGAYPAAAEIRRRRDFRPECRFTRQE